jgi:hypothetical protein
MNKFTVINTNQIVTKYSSINKIKTDWDTLVKEPFQTSEFLYHLEITNPCKQRYYLLLEDQIAKVAAVVYCLNVNLFTFSKSSVKVKMNIIGIPASVDSSGIIGDDAYFPAIISEILHQEKGIILAMNYENKIDMAKIVPMNTLPTFIFKHTFKTFEEYLLQMRHHYRRNVLNCMKQFQDVKTKRLSCKDFTLAHYELYLNIMKRTHTKLEILPFRFFNELPDNYTLIDYRDKNGTILSWHITCSFKGIYAFLFGGINYEWRDHYNSYYNNLIGIYKEGIESGSPIINLGQTAAQPKAVLGAQKMNKLMFVYHKYWIIRSLLRLFKRFLTYKDQSITYTIFK